MQKYIKNITSMTDYQFYTILANMFFVGAIVMQEDNTMDIAIKAALLVLGLKYLYGAFKS